MERARDGQLAPCAALPLSSRPWARDGDAQGLGFLISNQDEQTRFLEIS